MANNPATTYFSNWNFYNNRVQEEANGGQFVSAETTLIAAGKPDLSKIPLALGQTGTAPTETEVYPIGLLESFGLQQNKQLQRIFEIGSSRSYFIPGRVIGSVSIGRTFYYGPSLLRVLYAYYKDKNYQIGTTTNTDYSTDALIGTAATGTEGYHVLNKNPGSDGFFIDLASDLFSQPTGMCVYFKDYNNDTVGAFYLQECYVQGHQLNVNSGSVLVMEGAQLQYDLLIPVKMKAG